MLHPREHVNCPNFVYSVSESHLTIRSNIHWELKYNITKASGHLGWLISSWHGHATQSANTCLPGRSRILVSRDNCFVRSRFGNLLCISGSKLRMSLWTLPVQRQFDIMKNILIPIFPFRFHICLLKKMLQPAIPGVSWSLAHKQPLNREFLCLHSSFCTHPSLPCLAVQWRESTSRSRSHLHSPFIYDHY